MAKNNDLQQVLKGLEKLDSNVDKIRTEDLPGLHTRMAVLETTVANLKEDVRKEAKRDAKIYGGIGSAVSTMIALVLGLRH